MNTKNTQVKQIRKHLLPMLLILSLMLAGTMLVPPARVVKGASDQWTLGCSANPSTAGNYLFSVAAQADDAVVAVGSQSIAGQFQPLVELWVPTLAGPCFQTISTPNPPLSGNSELYGVASGPSSMITKRAFWSVGYQGDGTNSTRTWNPDIGDWIITGPTRTLIEHSTDGGQTWNIVPSPYIQGATNILKGVVAGSDNDAWAVGYSNDGTGALTLILHWDGVQWNSVLSPNEAGATQNYLYAVSIVDSGRARAVGFSFYDPPLTPSENLQVSWDPVNQQWTEDQNKPVIGQYYNFLFGVTAIADDLAYAVGTDYPTALTSETQALKWRSYIEGWLDDADSPNPSARVNTFWGIAPVTSTYIWVVGSTGSPRSTLIARRIGNYDTLQLWVLTSSPNQPTGGNELRGVAVVPGTSPCAGGNTWAVGYYLDGGVARTLAMVYYMTPTCDLTP